MYRALGTLHSCRKSTVADILVYIFICFQDGRVGEHIHVIILWCSVLHDTKLSMLVSHKCVGGIYSHLCVSDLTPFWLKPKA